MLHEVNPYVMLYKQAFLIMNEKPQEEHHRLAVRLHMDKDADRRRHNLPVVEEIAAVIPGDGSEERSEHRDVVLCLQGGGLMQISHLHPSYTPLHYVMLFPRGEEGWHPDLQMTLAAGQRARSAKMSQRCQYANCLHYRLTEASTNL